MLKTVAASVASSLIAAGANAHASDSANAVSPDSGIIRVESNFSVADTVSRLEAALNERNVKIMAKVDHAANAAGAELDLPPTTLVIFGNPAAGTQLMQQSRSAGIDLPMKALIYETSDGVVLEYNDVGYVARRHGVPADLPVLSKIKGLLTAVTAEAAGGE